jgi:hypothetical protein
VSFLAHGSLLLQNIAVRPEPPNAPVRLPRDAPTAAGGRPRLQSPAAVAGRRLRKDAALDRPGDPAPPSSLDPAAWFGADPATTAAIIPWARYLAYFEELAAASPHLRAERYGVDVEGESLLLLTLTARENLVRLDDLRALQDTLSSGHELDPQALPAMIGSARAVVLVTAGIHPTEPAATAMLPGLVHALATGDDAITRRIRRECIVLVVPSLCPGGHELVRRWDEATADGPWVGTQPPQLYQRFTGHDNNRDWIAQSQPEVRATVERIHRVWRPHVTIDLHQLHASGPRYVLPPWVDPVDPSHDPALQAAGAALGQAMAAAMTDRGLAGVVTAAYFDAWTPARAYPHYHGGVRILGEAAGSRVAHPVDVDADDLLPGPGVDPEARTANHPLPWRGGVWGLPEAARYHRVAVEAALATIASERATWVARQHDVVRRQTTSAPRGYVVLPPAVQNDPSAVARLVEILRAGEVETLEVTRLTPTSDRAIPPGALVVPFAQTFGGYAETLLTSRRYPDNAPANPYDTTAHALPHLLGVAGWVAEFEAPIDGRVLPAGWRPPATTYSRRRDDGHLVLPARCNDVVALVQDLLMEGVPVGRLTAATTIDGVTHEPGRYVVAVADAPGLDARLQAHGIAAWRCPPHDDLAAATPLARRRVGILRTPRSLAADAGWTRFVLEAHRFAPIDVLPGDIRDGDALAALDVLVVPRLAVPDLVHGVPASDLPPELRAGLERAGLERLRDWVEARGRLLLIDSSAHLAGSDLGLPVSYPLVGVMSATAAAPGSLLELRLDPAHPVAWGYDQGCAVMVTGSPAFAATRGNRDLARVGWIAPGDPLLAGALPHDSPRPGSIALAQIRLGTGVVTLYGFRPLFRGLALGAFRLVFNAIMQPDGPTAVGEPGTRP